MFASHAHSRNHSRCFGRRASFADASVAAASPTIAADLRLFMLNFLGGLIFMSVYLA